MWTSQVSFPGKVPFRSHSFDWRKEEFAAVSAFLVREHSRSGGWRVLRWTVYSILAPAVVVPAAAFALRDWSSFLSLCPLTLLVFTLVYFFPAITGRTFLFHYNRRLAYYLQKRVLATPQESDELSAWIRKTLTPTTPYILQDSKG